MGIEGPAGRPADDVVRRVYAEEWTRAALDPKTPALQVVSVATRRTTWRTGIPAAHVREVADQPGTRALLVLPRRGASE